MERVILYSTFFSFLLGLCNSCHSPRTLDLRVTSIVSGTPNRSTYQAYTHRGKIIKVVTEVKSYEEKSHGRIRLDDSIPETVLSKLSISVGDRDVSPPRNEYVRFANPHVGSQFLPIVIRQDRQGYIYVYISGGDGGGSYKSRMLLSKDSWLRTEHRDPVTFKYEGANN